MVDLESLTTEEIVNLKNMANSEVEELCESEIERRSKIPSQHPSRSVVLATEYLAKVVDEDMVINNGTTALYWHLIATIQQHTNP